jgi:hypothetical protein
MAYTTITDELLARLCDLMQTYVIMAGEKNATAVPVAYNGGAGTLITFAAPYAGTYSLNVNCYDAAGRPISFKRTAVLSTGFTIIPDVDGFIDYQTRPVI